MGFVQVQAQRKEAEHSPGLVCPYCGRRIRTRPRPRRMEEFWVANAVTLVFGLRGIIFAAEPGSFMLEDIR